MFQTLIKQHGEKKVLLAKALYFVLCLSVISSSLFAKERLPEWKTKKGKVLKGMLLDVSGDRVTIGTHHGKTRKVKRSKLGNDYDSMIDEWNKYNAKPEGFKVNKTIIIKTLPEKMLYDVKSFIVKPGQRIKLIVANVDEMQHNLVICKKASKDGMDVANAAIKLGSKGMEEEWLPKHENLLVATGMIKPGTQQTLYFTAPKEKGVYPYICSFPGHAMLMRGKMIVGDISRIQNLTYKVFPGKKWNKLPDFKSLKPSAEGKLANGLLDLSISKKVNNYGIVYEGLIDCLDKGHYTFELASDDGSQLFINDQIVIDNDGLHAAKAVKSKPIKLMKGLHKIRVHYFDKAGQASLGLSWTGPGFETQKLSEWTPRKKGESSHKSLLIVAKDEAKMYRNFIHGASARGIGVGYPEKVNLTFDASTMNLSMMWQGKFIDGNRHWVNRGKGFQGPAGHSVVHLIKTHQFETLKNAQEDWPNKLSRKANEINRSELKFKGYRLDKKRYPTFLYQHGKTKIEDKPTPIDDEGTGFNRLLSIKGAGEGLYFRVAWGEIKEEGGEYTIDEKYFINIDHDNVILRPFGKVKELLVPVFKGDSSFSVNYKFLYASTSK